jgi:hypothetical protein
MSCSCGLKLVWERRKLRSIEAAQPHTLPAFICWLMYSACRSASATIVKVGFAAPG